MDTFKKAFLEKYPKYGCILEYFEEATGEPMEWANLTKLNLSQYVDYLSQRLAQNSVRQYCAKIKSVINRYTDEIEMPKDWTKIITPKNEIVVNTWLTDTELEAVTNYVPRTPIEKSVRGRFLIEAYTGARFSDAERLDMSNVENGQLTYISQKTHIRSSLPCKPVLHTILADNKELRKVDATTFNNNLRNICRRVGITTPVHVFKAGKEYVDMKYKFVSSHTGRRSFATNLYLRGCDLYSISKMMGHTSVEMTAQRYICCPMRNLSPDIMEYFK